LNEVQNFIDNLPILEANKCFYQHDGAPPHNGHLVNATLTEMFSDQYIANNGPFLWPPRSPDLTPLDFYFWGYIGNRVYATELTTKEDCQQRIRDAINSISPNTIRKATNNEVEKRIIKCLTYEGRQFENLRA